MVHHCQRRLLAGGHVTPQTNTSGNAACLGTQSLTDQGVSPATCPPPREVRQVNISQDTTLARACHLLIITHTKIKQTIYLSLTHLISPSRLLGFTHAEHMTPCLLSYTSNITFLHVVILYITANITIFTYELQFVHQ